MRVTAVGDCGVDRYLDLKADRPGGVSLNFAVNASQLFPDQTAVSVVTSLGSDPEADLVRAAVHDLGIDACFADSKGATSIQYIDREPSGEKVFVNYEAGVLATYEVGARERAIIAESDVLMAVVYAGVVRLFSSVMKTPSAGLRAVDFGGLVHLDDPVGLVDDNAGDFDVGFFGLDVDQEDLVNSLEAIALRHKRLFVVTLGEHGSLAIGGDHRLWCSATPVDGVVDTTGAGDTFAAGVLAAYTDSQNVALSLRKGADAAAETVARVGAFDAEMTPWE